jgi:glycine/D-amino acid oxidase-like deaminating enzyme
MTARPEKATAAHGTADGLLDVAVIGGGQAGLAMAWHLARRHRGFRPVLPGPAVAAHPRLGRCSASSRTTPPTSPAVTEAWAPHAAARLAPQRT